MLARHFVTLFGAPLRIRSASVDSTGLILTVVLDRAATGTGAITGTSDGAACTYTYSSGSGTATWVYAITSGNPSGDPILAGASVRLNAAAGVWVSTAGGVGNAAIVDGEVTNNSTAWNPSLLPGIAPGLDIATQRSLGLLWQDTGKTVPALVATDPIRVATCPWTGVDYTAPSDAARPLLYDEGGGKWSAAFDGVDDRTTASGGPTSATARVSGWAVRTGASGNVSPFQNGTAATTGSMDRPLYRIGSLLVDLQGHNTDLNSAWAVAANSNDAGVWMHAPTSKYAQNLSPLSSAAQGITAGDGNIYLASSSGGTLLWNGRIRGLVLANGTQTDATLALIQAYMMGLQP